jgi:phosphoribosylformylglycinamidine cyclo-ligase
MPDHVRLVKDNLFEVPPVFSIIQQSSGADAREMYQVFNMGCRLEIYTDEKNADRMIGMATSFGIDARVIGRVEEGPNQLEIRTAGKPVVYNA